MTETGNLTTAIEQGLPGIDRFLADPAALLCAEVAGWFGKRFWRCGATVRLNGSSESLGTTTLNNFADRQW